MWHAADLQDKLSHHASGYKFKGVEKPTFDWAAFKPQRDAYIHKLNGIYASNFDKEGVEYHHGFGRLTSANTVEVTLPDGKGKYTLNTDKICIAVGGHPIIPSDDKIPGASLGIDSDGFFDLEEQPKRVAVIGAGYIAVELAGVFNSLGTETHLVIRGETVLRTFDNTLQETLTPWMEKTGVKIHKTSNVTKVEGVKGQTLTVHTNKGEKIEVDTVLWAIGREAETKGMGLEELGVKLDPQGNVIVDEYQNSTVNGVYAIGDVQGKALLTPVAIAAGRRLSNRLFGPEKFKDDKLSYENIPTVVFSWVLLYRSHTHILTPFLIATPRLVPLDLLKWRPVKSTAMPSKFVRLVNYQNTCFLNYLLNPDKSSFRALYFSMIEEEHKEPTVYKLIVVGPEERIVGVHIIGLGSDEVMQGFGVAVKMGGKRSLIWLFYLT
jgi:glutathione reductase (NADPH)